MPIPPKASFLRVRGQVLCYGLEKEIKVNIEANHATLAGQSFEHELSYATAQLGLEKQDVLVIGLRRADDSLLAPAADTAIQPDDLAIVIAEVRPADAVS